MSRNLIIEIKARYSIFAALGVPEGTRQVSCLHPEKHTHGDANPSASVNDGRVHCHACNSGEDAIGVYALRNGITNADAVKALAAELGLQVQPQRIVATYDYHRADGSFAYQVVRVEPGRDGRRKDFYPRRRVVEAWAWSLKSGNYVPAEGWIYGPGDLKRARSGDGIPLPVVEGLLYRLPGLLAADRSRWVVIVEGERKADRAAELGFVATSKQGGAGARWLKSWSALFAGRRVAILPDNDEPGRNAATAIAEQLVGIAADVRIVELPGLAEKGDLVDWRGTAGELQALIDAAPAFAPPEAKPVDAEEPPLTDLGIADRFVAKHGDDVRYCLALKRWFIWDGSRWRPDLTGEALDRITEVARAETKRAADEPADLGQAKKQESAPRLKGALDLAGVSRGIRIAPDAIDADPWLLTVRNGTIDLRTGKLRPHAKADMITKLVDLCFDPDAPCPRFLRFLSEIMAGDQEMVTLLRRWFGYCLTADTTEHVIMFFTGTGRNGKGVLVRAVKNVLGPMASTAPEGLLTVSHFERHPAELEVLRSRRLVIASELPKAAVFNEARMKQLTGGDEVSARGMRENFTDLVPTAKILIQANHKPKVSDDSPAFWERMRVVPFPVSFAGREDRGLDDALRAEAAGILAWMVSGCLEWRLHRLPRPEKVERATQEYRGAEDVLGRWEADRIAREEAMVDVPAKDLWEDFQRWAREEDEKSGTQTSFGRELTARAWTKDRTRTGIVRSHPRFLLGGERLTVVNGCPDLPVSEGELLSHDARAHARMEAEPDQPFTTVNRSQGFAYDPDEGGDE